MDEALDAPKQATEKCGRCLQPILLKAARCPECGHPVHNPRRSVLMATAWIGLLALLFFIFAVYRAEVQHAALVEEDLATTVDEPEQPPSTSQEVPPPPKDEKPVETVAPEKPPPLNR